MIFLIDFEKAFDSVSWSIIKETLKFFGFGDDILKWISILYKNANSSRIINGTMSPCQGDPPSPYIFLLCAEILAALIKI